MLVVHCWMNESCLSMMGEERNVRVREHVEGGKAEDCSCFVDAFQVGSRVALASVQVSGRHRCLFLEKQGSTFLQIK